MMSIKKKLNINLYRKRRYKPLYKKFINLKKNVQYRRKLMFCPFKKRKWQEFKNYIRKINFNNSTKNFIVFDHNRYSISTFFRYIFKKKFQYNLFVKKRLVMFYGFLTENKFKNYVHSSIKKTNLVKTPIKFNFFLMEKLEKRLDVVLYRSHFASSIRNAQQLVSHKQVYINKKIVKNKSYNVQVGDLIEIKSKSHHLITENIKNHHLWPVVPKYLQINYKTFQIMFFDNIKTTNLAGNFPFWLDLNTVFNYYKC